MWSRCYERELWFGIGRLGVGWMRSCGLWKIWIVCMGVAEGWLGRARRSRW